MKITVITEDGGEIVYENCYQWKQDENFFKIASDDKSGVWYHIRNIAVIHIEGDKKWLEQLETKFIQGLNIN